MHNPFTRSIEAQFWWPKRGAESSEIDAYFEKARQIHQRLLDDFGLDQSQLPLLRLEPAGQGAIFSLGRGG